MDAAAICDGCPLSNSIGQAQAHGVGKHLSLWNQFHSPNMETRRTRMILHTAHEGLEESVVYTICSIVSFRLLGYSNHRNVTQELRLRVLPV